MNEHGTQYALDVVQAMADRTIRRLWVVVIILIVLLAATNGAWIWYESQFEDMVITADQETDGGGDNYAIGGDLYGAATSDN